MMLKIGQSYGINDVAITNPSGLLSASFGLYRYFNINSKSGLIHVHYLRTEINTGFRSGSFIVNSQNQMVRISSNYIDLTLILPISWEITDQIVSNIGIGGSLGFETSRSIFSDIQPTPAVKDGISLKPGIIFDYHLLFLGTSNAQIGTRVLIQPSQYSYFEWSVYFGFAMPRKSKSKKGEEKK
jgi:hypothetical protein